MAISARLRAGMARRARRKLLPGAIAAAGRKGFTATKAGLEGKKGVRSPSLLAGWLKGQAHKKGVLAPEHAYGRRRK